jgi:hypothetical protein
MHSMDLQFLTLLTSMDCTGVNAFKGTIKVKTPQVMISSWNLTTKITTHRRQVGTETKMTLRINYQEKIKT